MEITKLDPKQKKRAAQVLAAAFFDYPAFTFYFPDPKRRAKYLPWYLGNVLSCALRYGEVDVADNISGVVFTLPPGHTRMSLWEYIQNGFLLSPFLLGFRTYKHSMECEDFVGNAQERIMAGRPHYYLWGLVADPSQQKKGVGKALMAPVLANADQSKMPVYLETHNEKNVAYYQNMGFELAYTGLVPKHNLRVWCMVREPK